LGQLADISRVPKEQPTVPCEVLAIERGNWRRRRKRGRKCIAYASHIRFWRTIFLEENEMGTQKGEGWHNTGEFYVMGPDGIPIAPKPFKSKEAAETASKAFIERFRTQGFYSSPFGRISLDELPHLLVVIPASEWDED
jgi:hypothetical protein